jgi:carboxypeptidase family protein/TonB-dependent receptor-like protein
MYLFRSTFPALAVGVCLAASAHAQGSASVTGLVLDRQSQLPIVGALVRVLTSGQETRSDSGGRFRQADIPPGLHLVQVRAVGYSSAALPVVLARDSAMDFRVELELLRYELPTVLVEGQRGGARARDFEYRRAQGVGEFITAEEIERRQSRTLAELLRSVAGIQVSCRTTSCDVRMPRGCRPEYFLDGFPATFATGPDFPLTGIGGIEVYKTQNETPPEFQRLNATCGAIVIWSKHEL